MRGDQNYGKKDQRPVLRFVPADQSAGKVELCEKVRRANEARHAIINGGKYWPAIRELLEHIKRVGGEKIYRIDTFLEPELFKMFLTLYLYDESSYKAFKKEYDLHLRIMKNKRFFVFATNMIERVLKDEKEPVFFRETYEGLARGLNRVIRSNKIKLEGEKAAIIKLENIYFSTRTGAQTSYQEQNNFLMWLIQAASEESALLNSFITENTGLPVQVSMVRNVFVLAYSTEMLQEAKEAAHIHSMAN